MMNYALQLYQRVNYERIACLIADGAYTTIYYADGRQYVASYRLGVILDTVPAMIQLHRATAVHPDSIVSWQLPRTNCLFVTVLVGNETKTFQSSILQTKAAVARLLADVPGKQIIRPVNRKNPLTL